MIDARGTKRIELICAFAVLCVPATWTHVAVGEADNAERSYDVEAILDGMLAAEARFHNLYLEWTVTFDGAPDQPIEGVYAHKDIDNGNRKMYLAVKCSAPIPGMQGSDSIAGYDGAKTIWLRSREGGKGPRAYIDPGMVDFHFRRSNPYNTWYELWQYNTDKNGRTLSMAQWMKEHIDLCKIEDPDVTVLGVHTVQFSLVDPNTTAMVRLWVSPERSFLILRRRSGLGDAPTSVGVIMADNLVQLPNGLWFPKTIYGPAGRNYTISKISIEPMPDELFSPKLPAGTLVTDKVAGTTYTVGIGGIPGIENTHSGAGGSPRDATTAETRLIEHGNVAAGHHRIWITILAVLLVLLSVGIIAFAHRRSGR